MKSDDLKQLGKLIDDKLEIKLNLFGQQLMAEIGKFMEDHLFPIN